MGDRESIQTGKRWMAKRERSVMTGKDYYMGRERIKVMWKS